MSEGLSWFSETCGPKSVSREADAGAVIQEPLPLTLAQRGDQSHQMLRGQGTLGPYSNPGDRETLSVAEFFHTQPWRREVELGGPGHS